MLDLVHRDATMLIEMVPKFQGEQRAFLFNRKIRSSMPARSLVTYLSTVLHSMESVLI